MKLGVGPITCQRAPFADQTWDDIYGNMLDYARTADDCGLDSFWVTEHHFIDDGYMSSPLSSLAAIAGVTESIAVGSSINLLPLHHPLKIAEHTATIDLLSDGRLLYGAGLGYRDEEFEVFGIDKSERTGRIEDSVNVIRSAWSDGPLEYDSEYYDIPDDIEITPKPQSPPPILLAGHAKPAVRRAARHGAGWLAMPTASPDDVEKRVADIEDVRERSRSSEDFTCYPGARGFVAESSEQAWETIKHGLFHMYRQYAKFGLPAPDAFEDAESIEELPQPVIDKMKDEAVYGSPASVTEELREYRDAAGDDSHFVFRVFIPGVEREQMLECLELLGSEVQPHL
jgi:alkanesulfonate monooxygenase SsuD/methylene tetrahydromethanopterin reductase-like flavin-dependent oxidoreductase (luciferase family)